MKRYEVIEHCVWLRDDGRRASIYGACPWTSDADKLRWVIFSDGYTVRDNVSNTVGLGHVPWKTKVEAELWVKGRLT